MTKDSKPIEIVFAPGCFDSFDGTQEELDAMVKQISDMAESGELFERSVPLNIDDMPVEEMVALAGALGIDIEHLTDEFIEHDAEGKRILQ